MDTKLKRFSYHWVTKMIAFLIVVVAFGMVIAMSASVFSSTGEVNELFAKDYIGSNDAQRIYSQICYNAHEIVKLDDSNQIMYLKNAIEKQDGVYVYAQNGDRIYQNSDKVTIDEFQKYRYNIITSKDFYEPTIDNAYNYSQFSDIPVYFAFDNDFIAGKQVEFEQHKIALQRTLSIALAIFIFGLFALIYLIFVCGRDKDKNLKMMTIDTLWTEITIGLMFATVFASFGMIIIFQLNVIIDIVQQMMPLVILIAALFCSVGLMFLLSIVRHIKNKTLIKHSFIYLVCSKIKIIFKTIFNITPLNIKIIGAILVAEIMTFIATLTLFGYRGAVVFGFIFGVIGTVTISYFTIKYIIKPYDDEVKTRLEISLSKELKAEKLKTELITNVSHDLKTPLTSIINYADLLLKENENNEYAKVIFDKSQKLKNLTEDLFDISKAQSGNIKTDMKILDVAELLNQTMAEVDTETIDFKVNIKNVKVFADGKLMNRVFENLVQNIVKYSLENTRAYIDAYEQNSKIYITFKNISNYEMNFKNDEITERFVRADTSRTTDGNGLGLAIAESYTVASGGKFEISVDGDLFKVTAIFDKV